MSELTAPDITFGFLILAVLIMWGAWQEHRRDNRRDAALLAGVGFTSLIGSALFWFT
jgi:predicted negative regulator of RcsB-dependent stress response